MNHITRKSTDWEHLRITSIVMSNHGINIKRDDLNNNYDDRFEIELRLRSWLRLETLRLRGA
jgi:hypothetical protein